MLSLEQRISRYLPSVIVAANAGTTTLRMLAAGIIALLQDFIASSNRPIDNDNQPVPNAASETIDLCNKCHYYQLGGA